MPDFSDFSVEKPQNEPDTSFTDFSTIDSSLEEEEEDNILYKIKSCCFTMNHEKSMVCQLTFYLQIIIGYCTIFLTVQTIGFSIL